MIFLSLNNIQLTSLDFLVHVWMLLLWILDSIMKLRIK